VAEDMTGQEAGVAADAPAVGFPAARARRDLSFLPVWRQVLLSAGWGVGVGAGVALGAVLTAASESGDVGLAGIDVSSDLVMLPWLSGLAVFLVHLAFTLGLGVVRQRRASHVEAEPDQRGEDEPEDGVEGHVGTEVPPSQS
jgi:hypothetical protein